MQGRMHPFTLTKRIDICPGPDIHSVPSHHQHICANPGRTKRRLHAGTCDFGSFPHIKLQTENLSVHAYTPLSLSHTHTEFGPSVNSPGNIICKGTAAGSLERQNGRVGSLSQTQIQTAPHTLTGQHVV